MNNILLTIACILVTIATPFIFGLPLPRWLSRHREHEMLWVKAPFIGLGVIILVLQNLVYMDLRLGLTTFVLWGGAALVWARIYSKHSSGELLSGVPRGLLVAALIVYLIQGLGIFCLGSKYYLARTWIDQYNYTAGTQCLMDHPFSMKLADVQWQPYLYKGIQVARDRIGQCIVQGFLAETLHSDAKTLFEPAILLSPLLMVFAIYGLGRRLQLSSRAAVLAAGAGGLLPSVAYIHLHSFFSQAFGTPFLLIFPLFLDDLLIAPGWGRILAAAIVLAAGISCYPEFIALFVLEAVVVMAVFFAGEIRTIALPFNGRGWLLTIRKSGFVFLVFAVALALNPGFARCVLGIMSSVTAPGLLLGIFPHASDIRGIERLFL